jgi:hypothetical protein
MVIVTNVVANRDYTLTVTFKDGKVKLYDMKPNLGLEIFRPIRNITYFLTAHVDYNTVVWDHGTDIAPEELYINGVEINNVQNVSQ